VKLRFVQGFLPEDPDMPDMPWIITVRRVPTETDLTASVEWRATEEEVNGPDRPETYEIALRLLDHANQVIGESVLPTGLVRHTVVRPHVLPSLWITQLGEHTLEVTLAGARATLPVTFALSEAPEAARPSWLPTARAERGRELHRHAAQQWPAVYGESDAVLALVHDAVHAALADVPPGELPDRLGAMLGEVAADALGYRSLEAGNLTEPWEVERLIARLEAAVRARHFVKEK
jgi:hypothetical protein